MKIRLTSPWKRNLNSKSSIASSGTIALGCEYCFWDKNKRRWIGGASIMGIHAVRGKPRKSPSEAQRDAERLAVQLLRDIRDGTKALMDQYGMGEDD